LSALGPAPLGWLSLTDGKGRSFESYRVRHFGTKPGTPKPAVFVLEARCDLTLPLQLERNRAQQAMNAWKPKGRASGLPCDHDRTSSLGRAANRYAALDGARDIDSKRLFRERGTAPFCTVPLHVSWGNKGGL
jgi:hypothetical protein